MNLLRNRHFKISPPDIRVGFRLVFVGSLLCLFLVGCAQHRLLPPPTAHPDVKCAFPVVKASTPQAGEDCSSDAGENSHGCPDTSDVHAAIDRGDELIDEAQSIVQSAGRVTTAASSSDLDAQLSANVKTERAKISAWRAELGQWANENSALTSSCELLYSALLYSALLYSAHGEISSPEIPVSLQNLKKVEEWLGDSIDAAEKGDAKAATAYIKGARMALQRADLVLKRKIRPGSRAAVLKTPKFSAN